MTEINMTFNHDIQGYKKGQARKIADHNEHDVNKNHKNKGILYGETKYNFVTDDAVKNMNGYIKELYQPEVERRNAHLLESVESNKISQQKYLERLTTVNSLTDNKVVCSGIVMQMGNLETMIELQDALGIDYDLKKVKDKDGNEYERPIVKDPKDQEKWANFWRETYIDAFNTSLRHSKAFNPFQAAIHLDEATPHMHIACVNNGGKTKTGKQRSTINSTVIEFLEEKGIGIQSDNRANLKAFRAYTDQVLYESAQKMLSQYYPDKDVTLKFTRTGGKAGLSEDAYHDLASVNSKVKKAKKELKDTETKLEDAEAKLKDAETQKNGAESDFKDALRKLAQIQAKNAQMEDDVRKNEKRIKEQQEELERLEAEVEQRKAKERELAQREAEVKRRELYANVTEADREDLKYSWVKYIADVSGESIFNDGVVYGRGLESNAPWKDNVTWQKMKKKYVTKKGIDDWFDGAMPQILKVRKRKRPNLEKSKAQDNGLEL